MIHCMIKGRFSSTVERRGRKPENFGLRRAHSFQAIANQPREECLAEFSKHHLAESMDMDMDLHLHVYSPSRLEDNSLTVDGSSAMTVVPHMTNVFQSLNDLCCVSGNYGEEGGECLEVGEVTMPTPSGHGQATLGLVCVPHRVSFGIVRGKKAGRPWRGRLKSRRLLPASGPTIFSALALCDDNKNDGRSRFYPRIGCRSSSSSSSGPRWEGKAWLDLDGRLVNADTATALKTIQGQLGTQESLVWDGLCPLQRVLVVAVAAASVTKEKTSEDVLRLRHIIKKQETALALMREELGNLLRQVSDERAGLDGQKTEHSPADSIDDLVDLLNQIRMQNQCPSDLEEEHDRVFSYEGDDQVRIASDDIDAQASESPSEVAASPAGNGQLCFSDLTRRISPIKEESPAANGGGSGGSGGDDGGGPEQELIEKMIMSNNWIEALDIDLLLAEHSQERECLLAEDDPSVNKDVVFEQNISGGEPGKDGTGDTKGDNYRLRGGATWERSSNVPHAETFQEVSTSMEWLSESSSVIMDPFSPMPSEKTAGYGSKGGEEHPRDWLRKTLAEEKSVADRARCATIILDVKKQVIALLDEAAVHVLEALAFINDKVPQLAGPEINALTPKKPEDARNRKSQVSAAIQEKAVKTSTKVASLQTAMMQLLDSLVPEAMASLEITPSDFDDYIANLQIAKILNDDASEPSTTGMASIQSWQAWFRRGFDNPETSFLKSIQASGETEGDVQNETRVFGTLEPLSLSKPERPPAGSVYHPVGKLNKQDVSPGGETIREKVEKILVPLHDKDPELELAWRTTTLATVSGELVAEFEKSSAKVASLKTYLRACDVKRKQVEKKLLEAWEQDSKTQAKRGNEITELKKQVRLKEAAYKQQIASRKALVASKSKEISKLREDCRRHNLTLQDMVSAAKATQESSEKRLAMLEEINRKKDNSIISLRQEIFELEAKVQELQACQTPAQLRPMNIAPSEREREADTESTDDLFEAEGDYRMFNDECQLRSSYQSFCGSENRRASSENRRTSWGSDLSAQEFHIIDTPWSSELTAGQDFNIIEEAAFQGQTLSIFHNVTPSQEFLRSSLRRLGTTPGGGIDTNNGEGIEVNSATSVATGATSSSHCSSPASKDLDSRPTMNVHREARRVNKKNVPNYRKELSKSVTNMSLVTGRSKSRDDKIRASTGVLASVGLNTPLNSRHPGSSTKDKSQTSLPGNSSSGNVKPKENVMKGRQKWV